MLCGSASHKQPISTLTLTSWTTWFIGSIFILKLQSLWFSTHFLLCYLNPLLVHPQQDTYFIRKKEENLWSTALWQRKICPPSGHSHLLLYNSNGFIRCMISGNFRTWMDIAGLTRNSYLQDRDERLNELSVPSSKQLKTLKLINQTEPCALQITIRLFENQFPPLAPEN